jgi:uncharacterized protein DUF4833
LTNLPEHGLAIMRKFRAAAFALPITLLCLVPVVSGAAARTLSSQLEVFDKVPTVRPEFPVPSEPNQLFYIQRSVNDNTVIYAANLDGRGHLDRDKPVNVYWRWYNVDGHKKPLNFLERMMAYGVRTVSTRSGNAGIGVRLAALPERELTLDEDDKGKPEAVLQMGNHLARLVYVYLQVDDHGFMPSVKAIDVFGIDKLTGKALREHIVQE